MGTFKIAMLGCGAVNYRNNNVYGVSFQFPLLEFFHFSPLWHGFHSASSFGAKQSHERYIFHDPGLCPSCRNLLYFPSGALWFLSHSYFNRLKLVSVFSMGIEIIVAPYKWMGGKINRGAKKCDKSSTRLCEFLPPSSSSIASKVLSIPTHG